ncbi:hypothetical protein BSKO_08141 [Bryopsis sp. KO-2023]|nr:hypothetical protein BSKO_08141 [Bryopsis sp. KO-2023]
MYYDGRRRTSDVLGTVESFSKLVLPPPLRRALTLAGFKHPSPVQESAIPLARLGSDLIVQAKSGTGKTLVFAIACLERVDMGCSVPQAMVVCPTRELAQQCAVEITRLSNNLPPPPVSCGVFIGGVAVNENRRRLRRPCHVVVGTPGRLAWLVRKRELNLDALKVLVLDEADQLFTPSMQGNVEFLLHNSPDVKQFLAFSATYTPDILSKLESLMHLAQRVLVSGTTSNLLGVRQCFKLVKTYDDAFEAKSTALLDLLTTLSFHQTVVFCNQQRDAERLSARLTRAGFPSRFISGLKTQEERTQTMAAMRDFELRVIVSTDLVARGVDLERVNLVCNLDLPGNCAMYQHRIGRTGRFGTYGVCVSFVTERELERLNDYVESFGGEVRPLPGEIPEDWYAYDLKGSEEKVAYDKLLQAPVVAEPMRHFSEEDPTSIGAAGARVFDFWREFMGKTAKLWHLWDPYDCVKATTPQGGSPNESEALVGVDGESGALDVPTIENAGVEVSEKTALTEALDEQLRANGLVHRDRLASVSSFGFLCSEEGGACQDRVDVNLYDDADLSENEGSENEASLSGPTSSNKTTSTEAESSKNSSRNSGKDSASIKDQCVLLSDSGALEFCDIGEVDNVLGSVSGSIRRRHNVDGKVQEVAKSEGDLPLRSSVSLASKELRRMSMSVAGIGVDALDEVAYNAEMYRNWYGLYDQWAGAYSQWYWEHQKWFERYQEWCMEYQSYVSEHGGEGSD